MLDFDGTRNIQNPRMASAILSVGLSGLAPENSVFLKLLHPSCRAVDCQGTATCADGRCQAVPRLGHEPLHHAESLRV